MLNKSVEMQSETYRPGDTQERKGKFSQQDKFASLAEKTWAPGSGRNPTSKEQTERDWGGWATGMRICTHAHTLT